MLDFMLVLVLWSGVLAGAGYLLVGAVRLRDRRSMRTTRARPAPRRPRRGADRAARRTVLARPLRAAAAGHAASQAWSDTRTNTRGCRRGPRSRCSARARRARSCSARAVARCCRRPRPGALLLAGVRCLGLPVVRAEAAGRAEPAHAGSAVHPLAHGVHARGVRPRPDPAHATALHDSRASGAGTSSRRRSSGCRSGTGSRCARRSTRRKRGADTTTSRTSTSGATVRSAMHARSRSRCANSSAKGCRRRHRRGRRCT
jgi:hypothetical protein